MPPPQFTGRDEESLLFLQHKTMLVLLVGSTASPFSV